MSTLSLALALCLPQDVGASSALELALLRGEGDTATVVDPRGAYVTTRKSEWVLDVRNPGAAQELRLQVWLPPDLVARGLPTRLSLRKGERRRLPWSMLAEPGRCGLVWMRIRLLPIDEAAAPQARLKQGLHVAVGNELLRLGFEQRSSGVMLLRGRLDESKQASGKRVRGDAAGGLRFLRLASSNGARKHTLLAARPGFDARLFPFVCMHARGSDAAAGSLLVRYANGSQQTHRLPLAGDGAWRRCVVKLAPPRNSSSVLALILRGTTGSVDVDDLSVARSAEASEDDKLRGLTERYRHSMGQADGKELAESLATISVKKLSTEGRIDHALLYHALQLRQALSKVGAKVPGEPAGKARFVALLRHRHHLKYEPEELLQLGRTQIIEHQAKLQELAAKIAAGKSWRQVVEILKDRHPTAEQLPKVAESWMHRARDFVLERQLVTVPQGARHARIKVVTEDSLSRTYPFGGYGGVLPSRHGFTGTYFVSPPAVWMNKEQAIQRLRGNHLAKTRIVALHEVIPGHHLQTVVHKMRPLSRFRRLFYSTVFAEGWALYCEEMMFEQGFYPDDSTRFAQMQMRLWRACRIVLDVGLHTGSMSQKKAADMLVAEVAMDRVNAQAEVRRYIDNPTRPLSYLVGYLLIRDLVDRHKKRLGDAFDLRRFHDKLLSFGPLPLPLVVRAMDRD